MNTLPLSNLRFRTFLGEEDYPVITAIINSCKTADGMDHSTTLEDVRATYTHLVNCDPARDMLFAEVEGRSVGYVRADWQVDSDGNWLGFSVGYVIPEYRRRGIGRTLLDFAETRLREISSQQIEAGELSSTTPRFFNNNISDKEVDKEALLKRAGYQPIRYMYQMVRPDLENIPDLPLP
jgi:GNAT superfamily N-acetyltransferase